MSETKKFRCGFLASQSMIFEQDYTESRTEFCERVNAFAAKYDSISRKIEWRPFFGIPRVAIVHYTKFTEILDDPA